MGKLAQKFKRGVAKSLIGLSLIGGFSPLLALGNENVKVTKSLKQLKPNTVYFYLYKESVYVVKVRLNKEKEKTVSVYKFSINDLSKLYKCKSIKDVDKLTKGKQPLDNKSIEKIIPILENMDNRLGYIRAVELDK